MANDYFGMAAQSTARATAPPIQPARSAARHVHLLAALVLAFGVVGAGGFFVTRSGRSESTNPPLAIPDTIAGYRLTGSVMDMMKDPKHGPYNKAHGVSQDLQAQFAGEGADPTEFTLRVFRKPAYSRRDPAEVLADAFRGDAQHPDFYGPAQRVSAGPLGGALSCKTVGTGGAACNWAHGDVVGSVRGFTQDLDALAALTQEVRAVVQQ